MKDRDGDAGGKKSYGTVLVGPEWDGTPFCFTVPSITRITEQSVQWVMVTSPFACLGNAKSQSTWVWKQGTHGYPKNWCYWELLIIETLTTAIDMALLHFQTHQHSQMKTKEFTLRKTSVSWSVDSFSNLQAPLLRFHARILTRSCGASSPSFRFSQASDEMMRWWDEMRCNCDHLPRWELEHCDVWWDEGDRLVQRLELWYHNETGKHGASLVKFGWISQ